MTGQCFEADDVPRVRLGVHEQASHEGRRRTDVAPLRRSSPLGEPADGAGPSFDRDERGRVVRRVARERDDEEVPCDDRCRVPFDGHLSLAVERRASDRGVPEESAGGRKRDDLALLGDDVDGAVVGRSPPTDGAFDRDLPARIACHGSERTNGTARVANDDLVPDEERVGVDLALAWPLPDLAARGEVEPSHRAVVGRDDHAIAGDRRAVRVVARLRVPDGPAGG